MSQKVIVIIDDSETNLILTESLLEELGDYKIYTVRNSSQAVKTIERYQPDLILLDLMMPKIDGFDILKVLKNKQETKTIPVIIVSAKTDEETKKITTELGASDFIEKPIGINHLIDRVQKFL